MMKMSRQRTQKQNEITTTVKCTQRQGWNNNMIDWHPFRKSAMRCEVGMCYICTAFAYTVRNHGNRTVLPKIENTFVLKPRSDINNLLIVSNCMLIEHIHLQLGIENEQFFLRTFAFRITNVVVSSNAVRTWICTMHIWVSL